MYVLTVFILGQILEGSLLTPWLVGDRIGLHPVAVIFAVLAGGQLFGFIGVLLALPVAAVLMVLVRYWLGRYLASGFYLGDAVPATCDLSEEDAALDTRLPRRSSQRQSIQTWSLRQRTRQHFERAADPCVPA